MKVIVDWLKKHIYFPVILIFTILSYLIFKERTSKKIDKMLEGSIKSNAKEKITALDILDKKNKKQIELAKQLSDQRKTIIDQHEEEIDKIEKETEHTRKVYEDMSNQELESVFAKKYNLKRGNKDEE